MAFTDDAKEEGALTRDVAFSSENVFTGSERFTVVPQEQLINRMAFTDGAGDGAFTGGVAQ